MPELAEDVLGMPVRRGIPMGVGGLVDVVKNPSYATGVGLILWGNKNRGKRQYKGGLFGGAINALAHQLKKLFI